MRHLPIAFAVVTLVACGGGSDSAVTTTTPETTAASALGPVFVVELAGDAEVPGPGAAEASGRLELEVSAAEASICVNGEVDGTDEITALHLHSGTADEPSEGGDLTIDLGQQPGEDDPLAPYPLNYCVSAGDADLDDLLAELAEDPGDYFVHVVTADFPDGAARGQLAAG